VASIYASFGGIIMETERLDFETTVAKAWPWIVIGVDIMHKLVLCIDFFLLASQRKEAQLEAELEKGQV